MENVYDKALKLHEENKGKISVETKVKVTNKEELSLAYSPGVAEPCRKIAANKEDVYKYTSKGNTVLVVTDGTAVLGLGDIGPQAALPVMEGKAVLFKEFGGIDAFPICLDTKDPSKIIETCKLIAPGIGGINLEDISAPRCVEIERALKKELDIPVFHDDQHGTAIVSTAGLINACKLTNRNIKDLKVVVSGTGAAGSSIAKMLKNLGVKDIYGYNIDGVVHKSKYDNYDFLLKELIDENIFTNDFDLVEDSLACIIKNTDVFIGVSAPGIVTQDMIKSMNDDAIVFAMANPTPEIMPKLALEAGAKVVGTGRSDFPNQVNNVLAFPGIFKGAFMANAHSINEEMKLAAAYAIADVISENELTPDYIIPSPFNEKVVEKVARAVKETAIQTKVCKEKLS